MVGRRLDSLLILQGFREPLEWDEGSVASPVAFASTLRIRVISNLILSSSCFNCER